MKNIKEKPNFFIPFMVFYIIACVFLITTIIFYFQTSELKEENNFLKEQIPVVLKIKCWDNGSTLSITFEETNANSYEFLKWEKEYIFNQYDNCNVIKNDILE